MNPNSQQQKLIENTEGVYLVDAGAGTGKTFTVTRRYAEILDKGVEPEDIFLATFTRNAADEMSERIAEKSDRRTSEILEAPISTFHSHCQKIMRRHGFDSPELLGIEDYVTEELTVMESRIRELQEFNEFYRRFRTENPEYSDLYRIVREESNLLSLLKTLAARGIIPEKNGWFGDSEKYLDGDEERFAEIFKEKNKPRETSNGMKQSLLREKLYSYRWKDFPENAPDIEEIRGDRGTKSIRRDFLRKSFEEDREQLKKFIHDLYIGYIEHCLSRGYLNFSFLMALTFVLLHERPEVRAEEKFDYLMIDEFQDTNEIQFKLSLLMADKPNIAVVGDWKQSIYSFQHASVDNIRMFKRRLNSYISELNSDKKRVGFQSPEVERIRLKSNYRSAQTILDFAEETLELPANQHEQVETDDITSLESEIERQESTVSRFTGEDESEQVLSMIQEMVSNPEYLDSDGKELTHGDIAVLARTRTVGLEIQDKAREYGVPVAYEGGIELFRKPPALLLLAWLRILDSDSRRGWALVLERAGYKLDEAEEIFETNKYPENMLEFKEELQEMNSLSGTARKILLRYGYTDEVAEKTIEVVTEAFNSSYMNKGQIIQFIEQNIEEGEIYELDTSREDDVVKIQTIHAAKGLEYPAVIVAGVNQSVFPSKNTGSPAITYQEPIGLRTRKTYRNSEYSHVYDSWKTEILTKTLSGDYDEERRLFYVASTRAKNHLLVSAENDRESTFYSELEIKEVEPSLDLEKEEQKHSEREVLRIE